jgi:hypothetical protein
MAAIMPGARAAPQRRRAGETQLAVKIANAGPRESVYHAPHVMAG